MSLPPALSLYRRGKKLESGSKFRAILRHFFEKRREETGKRGGGEDGLQLTRDFLAIFGNTPVKIP